MARKYEVEGTKTFLWWALGLLVLALWCVKDGWFPSETVLAKHPLDDVNFYLFNKSAAILSMIASAVCGYIHLVVK